VRLSEKSFKNHIRKEHKEIDKEDWELWTRRVHAQTWGEGNNNKMTFAVEPGDYVMDGNNTSEYSASLIREFDEYCPQGIKSAEELCDTRVVQRDSDDLEFFTNFDKVVDLETATMNSGWVSGDNGGEEFNAFRKMVKMGTGYFFKIAEEETKKSPWELKQTINKPETSLGKRGNPTFSTYQDEKSTEKTIKCVTSLLTFVMVVCNKDGPYPDRLLPQEYSIDITNDDEDLADIATETYGKIINAGVADTGSGANAYEIILPLIEKIFLRRRNGSNNDDIIKKFIIVYHTKQTGRRDDSGEFTSTLSALIYSLRLTLIHVVVRKRNDGQARRKMEACRHDWDGQRDVAKEREEDMTREDKEVEDLIALYAHTQTVRVTVFSTLFSFRALLNSLAPAMAVL
jgi:hypothetical protein